MHGALEFDAKGFIRFVHISEKNVCWFNFAFASFNSFDQVWKKKILTASKFVGPCFLANEHLPTNQQNFTHGTIVWAYMGLQLYRKILRTSFGKMEHLQASLISKISHRHCMNQ